MLWCCIYPRSRNLLRLFARERRERGELDFYVVSFVQIIVHSTGQTDRPDLGGAPCPSSHCGKFKALGVNLYLSRASYSVLWCNTVMDRGNALDLSRVGFYLCVDESEP